MIRLIAFALDAATTPAFAQTYQPYNPNAPQHYNNAPGLYAPGFTGGGPRTYPGPGGYPYWSGYVDAPVDSRSPLLLDCPALLGRPHVSKNACLVNGCKDPGPDHRWQHRRERFLTNSVNEKCRKASF